MKDLFLVLKEEQSRTGRLMCFSAFMVQPVAEATCAWCPQSGPDAHLPMCEKPGLHVCPMCACVFEHIDGSVPISCVLDPEMQSNAAL